MIMMMMMMVMIVAVMIFSLMASLPLLKQRNMKELETNLSIGSFKCQSAVTASEKSFVFVRETQIDGKKGKTIQNRSFL